MHETILIQVLPLRILTFKVVVVTLLGVQPNRSRATSSNFTYDSIPNEPHLLCYLWSKLFWLLQENRWFWKIELYCSRSHMVIYEVDSDTVFLRVLTMQRWMS